jgi:hypothetical protein
MIDRIVWTDSVPLEPDPMASGAVELGQKRLFGNNTLHVVGS